MARTLLIPGLDGSPGAHWQNWWASVDPFALVVHQDDWSNPTPEAWETEVAGALLQHPGAILVAHSLGCLVVARLLARCPQIGAGGALLVAPADPHRDRRLYRFADFPRHDLPVPTTVVASRTDPWMAFDEARGLAADWGSRFIDLGDAGHINVASGFGPWPGGLALRDALAARTRHDVVPGGLRLLPEQRRGAR